METTPAQSLTNDERGFTLIEILLAITVMGVFMAAAAPGFYGLLKATALTNQRSVADGLAVKATEAIRSFPYYDVGYSTTAGTPSYCTGTQPVQLSYSTPMDTLASASPPTVAGTSYTVQSCVYWEGASDGSTNAYKQLQVNVLWGNTKQYTFSETSALYPGGEAAYSSPGGQNFAPGSTTATTTDVPISAPTAKSVTAISTSIMQVDWAAVSYSPTPQYNIEWWAGDASTARPAHPSVVAVGYGTSDGSGGLVGQVSGLSAGASYDFDVVAFAGSQTSLASNVETGSTTAASVPGCTLSGINVSPNSPVVDKDGSPVGWTTLSITVNAANCSNLTVEYGLDDSGGSPQAPLTLVPLGNSGSTWTGSATQSSWSAATYGFVVYNNGAATTLQQNITPCQEKGKSGHC